MAIAFSVAMSESVSVMAAGKVWVHAAPDGQGGTFVYPGGGVRFGVPLVVTTPELPTADVGVTPEQYCAAGTDPCLDRLALTEALPPTLIVVACPSGSSPPAQRPHCGLIHLNRVTFVMIFLIAIGLVAFGTKPTAVTTLMLMFVGWGSSVIDTLKL